MKKWNNNKSFGTDSVARSDEVSNHFKGSRVEVKNNDINFAMRKLKKILERDNLQRDLAKHEYFEKPSVKRKRARAAAVKRWEKEVERLKASGRWNDSTSRSTSNKNKVKNTPHPSKAKALRGGKRNNANSN
jgi:small subunit ribosomal protein S21